MCPLGLCLNLNMLQSMNNVKKIQLLHKVACYYSGKECSSMTCMCVFLLIIFIIMYAQKVAIA